VTAMITLSNKIAAKYKYILLATAKGLVKKTALSMYQKVRKTGILAIKLKGDDRLRWVKFTTGTDNIFQVSAKGQSIFYSEEDLRPMGRTAAGVRGIHLRGEDYAVSCDVIAEGHQKEADALIVMEKGFGKRTPLPMFKMQLRGGMGIRAAQVTGRPGQIVGMRIVYGEDYDVILASSKGQMIRMALKTIKRLQRDTQGVTLIRLNSGDKVTSVTVVRKDRTDKLDSAKVPEGPGEISAKPVEEVIPASKKPSMPPKLKAAKKAEVKKLSSKKITSQSPALGEKQSVTRQPTMEKQAEVVNEKAKGNLPDWAKAHTDSWRQPDIFKLKKDIKVHDYQEKKEDKLPLEDLKKPPKPSEPNYWGGKL